MAQTQGLHTEHMLNNASNTAGFFDNDMTSTSRLHGWQFKTPEEHQTESGIKSKLTGKYIFDCLDDIGQVNVPIDLGGEQLLAETVDRTEFIDLKRMLTMDEEVRITPEEVLNHDLWGWRI
ncbi:hypothetical protein HUJ04_011501 [Dendroctonus ponderosae]